MLRDYVQNIALIVIFACFLGLVLPRGKYKDYIKLITGLAVILAVISPVASFFTGRSLEEFFEEARVQIGMDIASHRLSGSHFEDSMRLAVLEEYRRGLNTQINMMISDFGYKLEYSVIYIDESDDNFGRISGLDLSLSKIIAESAQNFIRIERINVLSIDVGGSENPQSDESPEINSIKNLLSDFYNLSVENINIRALSSD